MSRLSRSALRPLFTSLLLGLVPVALGVGCGLTADPPSEGCVDKDEDGFDVKSDACPSGKDCDDTDPNINPDQEDVCGNGVDENCDGKDSECSDEGFCKDPDKDGYGQGEACRGTDCAPDDPEINPGAQDVCGDGVDQDCDGQDKECPEQCVDEDNDGFGKEGQNSDCQKDEPDCDDDDPDVNPDAEEVCNGKDDDCDGSVDECPAEGAECVTVSGGDEACRLSLGDECPDDGYCPENTVCDADGSGECRKKPGKSCSEGECIDSLQCRDGTCQGEACAEADCSGATPKCINESGTCVECLPQDDTNEKCDSSESCVDGGWCGQQLALDSADPAEGYDNVSKAMLKFSKGLADCWNKHEGTNDKDFCYSVVSSSGVQSIGFDDVESAYNNAFKPAYENGNLTGMSDEQYNTLGGLIGDGWTDQENLEFAGPVGSGTDEEWCIWFETDLKNEIFVTKCSRFSL